MVKKQYRIVWDDVAKLELKEAYLQVKKTSPANALKVQERILQSVAELQFNPLIYEADRFKKDNPGTYRAFEKDSYRVMYSIQKEQIVITGVRHAHRDPVTHY